MREENGHVFPCLERARRIMTLKISLTVKRDAELSRFGDLASTSAKILKDKGKGKRKLT